MSMLKLPPTQPGRLAGNVAFHLRRAHEAAQQSAVRALGDTGLLPIHLDVLALIGDNPGTIPSVLAETLGRDRSSITSSLHVLLERGLIERARTTRDRRASLLRLTAAGDLARQDLERRIARCDAVLDRVLARDKPALLEQLQRITATLAEGDRPDDPGV